MFGLGFALMGLFLVSVFFQHKKLSNLANQQQVSIVVRQNSIKKESVQSGFYIYNAIKFANSVDVFSQVDAKILTINTQQGALVKNTDAIFTIQRRDLDEEIKQETQRLENNKLTLSTNTKLYEQKMISKAEYLASVKNHQLSQQNLAKLLSTSNNAQIVSGFNGFIEKIYPQQNELIFASKTKLFTIKLQDKFYFETEISAEQKKQINNIGQVSVEVLNQDKPLILQGFIEQTYAAPQGKVKLVIVIDTNSPNYATFVNSTAGSEQIKVKIFCATSSQEAYWVPVSSIFVNAQNKFAIKYVNLKGEAVESEVEIIETKNNNFVFVYISLPSFKKSALPQSISIV